jgi:hypothetical protein
MSLARPTYDQVPVNARTRQRCWTFKKPFRLAGVDRLLPPGEYQVTTDEELIEGLSFPVYRRTATMIFVPRLNGSSAVEMFSIDPAALQIAHDNDSLDASGAKDATPAAGVVRS